MSKSKPSPKLINPQKDKSEKEQQLNSSGSVFSIQELESYLDLMPIIFLVLDKTGKITMINQEGSGIIGYKKDELLGKDWFETCIPMEERKRVKVTFSLIMGSKLESVSQFENSVLTKSGERIIVSWRNNYLKSKDGKIIGTVGFGIDVTDQRTKELEVEKNRDLYNTLVQSSPDCIKLFGLNGNLLFMNKGGMEEHNIKDEKEIEGLNVVDTVKDEYKEVFFQALEKARSGKSSTIELGHTKEGSNRDYCLETIVPVKDAQGKVINIFGVSRDISALKKAEEDLKEKYNQLEKFKDMTIGRELKMIQLKKELRDSKNEEENQN